MNRVFRHRVAYFVVVFCLLTISLVALYLNSWDKGLFASLVLLLLIPGRIQGLLLRELFTGRHELDRGNPQKARMCFDKLRVQVHRQPWRKYALWLSWSMYTPNLEAMLINNIATTYLAQGQNEEAEKNWKAALELDPLYPLPFANLAVVAALRGDVELSQMMLHSASELGYTGEALDKVAHQAQSILARVEAHGPSM